MNIEITQYCIDRGVPNSAEHCPISIAFLRNGLNYPSVFGVMTDDHVAQGKAFCYQHQRWQVAELNKDAVNFIEDFDKGEGVEPFMTSIQLRSLSTEEREWLFED